jgi:hypothetical protein
MIGLGEKLFRHDGFGKYQALGGAGEQGEHSCAKAQTDE